MPGKHPQIIVLDPPVLAIDPNEIARTEVLLTLLGGNEVHRADDFAG